MWLLLAIACVDEEAIAEEMERGLLATNQAVSATLVGAEVFRWAQAEPTVTLRHGTTCGCPCRERTDAADDAFVLLADYAELGCFPDSDLLPWPVQGHVTLLVEDDEAAASIDGFVLDGREEVSGAPRATVAPLGNDAVIDGRLTVGDMQADLAVTATFEPDAVRLDGDVTVPDGTVHLDGVRVFLPDVFGACPTPSSGASSVDADDEPIQVDLGLGDGDAEASYRDRRSSVVSFCAYRPEWW